MPAAFNTPSASPMRGAGGDGARGSIGFDDRLLAESVAALEQLEPTIPDDADASDFARQYAGDFESRLVHRASALSVAPALADALRHVRGAIGLMVATALVLALLGGVATARAALGVPRDEPVNIFHVLAATLLPQTLLLVAWLVVMFRPRTSGSLLSIASLGGVVVRFGQTLARRIHPGRTYSAAIAGLSHSFMRGGLGRWTFSSISHALWLAFNIGCLGMLMFLLSTRQYGFAWETTILSRETYRPLTKAIAALPKAAGFSVPTESQIDASRWEGTPLRQDDAASQAWSSLLVGSIIIYGFGPRVLLLGWSLGRRRAARSRYRLDVQRPEFARWRALLDPDVESIGVVDPSPRIDDSSATIRSEPHVPRARMRGGLPAITGLELPDGSRGGAWPPALHGVRWHDLGMIDSREDRQRAVNELTHAAADPAALVIVCSLTTTPDRGISASLAELAGCIADSPVLVLTGGQRLRERHASIDGSHRADVETRLADWRAAAHAAGIATDRIVEVDLDHLTHASQSKLTAFLGAPAVATAARRIDEAFNTIAAFAAESRNATDQRQAGLHADIARLYGDAPPRWRELLRLPSAPAEFHPAAIADRLSASATRFTALLPERLKRSPKWMAAGAAAGAMGCVAAAALISPVAIGALPVWSGVGAAIAAAMRLAPTSTPASAAAQRQDDRLDQAVRSAALFAMLLELQRFDEATITRVLDAAVVDETNPQRALAGAEDVRRWLDDLRHRFDLALAREVAR